MKRLILSLFTAISAFLCTALANTISVEWGKLIDGTTSAGDQAIDIAVDTSGNAYWLAATGTKTDALTVNFGGEALFEGAIYDGTSQNNNYTLIKTDSDGNKLWVVYSNSGDIENNAGGCALTSDGGVITAIKIRHTDGAQDKDINFVDASGDEISINWEEANGDARVYKLVVLKVSTDGKIDWTRIIDLDTTPGPNVSDKYAHGLANCFNLGNIAVDNKDNIYLALNYRNTISIGRSNGTVISLKPNNIDNWNGDPQSTCGDFMLLSLDKDGYYRNALTLEGSAKVAYCQHVAVDNDHIYAQGYITGNGTTLTVDGKTLAPSDIISPLVLATDSDLKVQWAKCFSAEQVQNKNAFQNVCINPVGSTLWVTGMYNLKFTDPDDNSKFLAATQGNIREGFILKLDATTGQWLAARDSRDDDWNKPSATAKTGLTGYMGVLQNIDNPDKIFVFGYVMNAQTGVFLREYDATTLVANLEDGQNNVITGGGVPSCQNVVYSGKNCAAYMTARGNNVFNLLGGASTEKPAGWGVLAAKVKLPESMKTSGIESIVIDSTSGNCEPTYYNLQGIRVTNPTPGQIYIRHSGNHTDKIIFQ